MLRTRFSTVIPALLIALCGSLALAQTVPQFPPKTEALQRRIKEFYGLLQQGRNSQAEAYVTKDSLQTFRSLAVGQFVGIELESIELDPSGKTATVGVQILYNGALSPGVTMKFPRRTTWRLDKSDWKIVVDAEPPPPVNGSGSSLQGLSKEDLQFQQKDGNIGQMQEGDKKEVHFAFKNIADHAVKIASVETGCPCLTVVSGVKSYAPGESGELVLAFDSTGYRFGYKQTVVVKTDPGNGGSALLVEAVPMPGPPAAAAAK